MRTRNIQARLKRLESRVPTRPTNLDNAMRYLYCIRMLAISYHLGDPQTDEPPIAAYARALGFEGPAQLLKTPPEMIAQRESTALDRLLAQFGQALIGRRIGALTAVSDFAVVITISVHK